MHILIDNGHETVRILTATKNTFSAMELQRLLGHKRYQPIWEMPHKLRDIMGKVLPWVHVAIANAIANAKTRLANIYHGIKPEFLQEYLNEFCYKFNRRYFGERLFDRMPAVATPYTPSFRQ